MSVKFIGDSYEFECRNREENYGGDINIYVVWDQHLMYATPATYRIPKDMVLRDFLEQVFMPDNAQHPDTEKVNWDNAVWEFYDQPWTPDLDKSFENNSVGHQSFLRFKTPGLEGLHGVGN
ncbi:MAG TPA: phenol hydroxylase [Porticoccus sp.]|nr:phenol hydroxylase [Porticoccus sp.]